MALGRGELGRTPGAHSDAPAALWRLAASQRAAPTVLQEGAERLVADVGDVVPEQGGDGWAELFYRYVAVEQGDDVGGVEPGLGQLGDHDGNGVATIDPTGSAHVDGGEAGVDGLALPRCGTGHARGAGGRDDTHHVGKAQVGEGAHYLCGEAAGVAGLGVPGDHFLPVGVTPGPVLARSDGQAVTHGSQGRSGAGARRRTPQPGPAECRAGAKGG